ncbi:MAG TPA: PRD domain-containing protein, partial [Thomasclavelia ramosa]|nr:PRD domain-containing protein [Thomasclavelia ramosa]
LDYRKDSEIDDMKNHRHSFFSFRPFLSKNQKLDLEINSGFDLLDDQVFKILRETMYTIYQDYHKDFRNDDKLFVAIGLHLEPALERLANGQLVENPLKEKIIERHQEEFNYSKILNDVVRHDLNLSFDDDELAFIALHFVVANNRIDE